MLSLITLSLPSTSVVPPVTIGMTIAAATPDAITAMIRIRMARCVPVGKQRNFFSLLGEDSKI